MKNESTRVEIAVIKLKRRVVECTLIGMLQRQKERLETIRAQMKLDMVAIPKGERMARYCFLKGRLEEATKTKRFFARRLQNVANEEYGDSKSHKIKRENPLSKDFVNPNLGITYTKDGFPSIVDFAYLFGEKKK